MNKTTIGIIGGSGICKFPELKPIKTYKIKTKFGSTSDDIIYGEISGIKVFFLPRHGKNHKILPHQIPYQANINAFKKIGVKLILATCIAGSLNKKIKPGDLVVPDQFIDMTQGRLKTTNNKILHLPMAEPYCSYLRTKLINSIKNSKLNVHNKATVVVIQGPRFLTTAESKFYMTNKCDLVNMTQYPECYLAKEAGICYANLASITDYDVGVKKSLNFHYNNFDKVLKIFKTNIINTRKIIIKTLKKINNNTCNCAEHELSYYYEN